MKRNIIEIDKKKCTGCGLCVPGCAEGALQIIDGKARLLSDLYCDGLGACIGHCPEGAIRIREREAKEYDERMVMENVVREGRNAPAAQLEQLKSHGQKKHLSGAIHYLRQKKLDIPQGEEAAVSGPDELSAPHGCPGAKLMDLSPERTGPSEVSSAATSRSHLKHWPIQIRLVPPSAPFLNGADLLIAADCVPFAYAGFHDDLLIGKVLLVGCPKFDDASLYLEKITQILKANEIRSLTVAQMEVPCCYGLVKIARDALRASGKEIPFREVEVGIKGDIQ